MNSRGQVTESGGMVTVKLLLVDLGSVVKVGLLEREINDCNNVIMFQGQASVKFLILVF